MTQTAPLAPPAKSDVKLRNSRQRVRPREEGHGNGCSRDWVGPMTRLPRSCRKGTTVELRILILALRLEEGWGEGAKPRSAFIRPLANFSREKTDRIESTMRLLSARCQPRDHSSKLHHRSTRTSRDCFVWRLLPSIWDSSALGHFGRVDFGQR